MKTIFKLVPLYVFTKCHICKYTTDCENNRSKDHLTKSTVITFVRMLQQKHFKVSKPVYIPGRSYRFC